MDTADAAEMFWAWFIQNEATIRAAYKDQDTQRLEDLIKEPLQNYLPGVGWEIGPYALPDHALVISPGVRERIPTVRNFVAHAPRIAGWKIFASKPPKDLTSLVFIVNHNEVCADTWRYRLTSWNGGEFVDIEIFFEERHAPPPGQELQSCELVLEALVGEEQSLDRIGRVQHHVVSSIEHVEEATSVWHLREQLQTVLRSAGRPLA
jgi:hypothetical protein